MTTLAPSPPEPFCMDRPHCLHAQNARSLQTLRRDRLPHTPFISFYSQTLSCPTPRILASHADLHNLSARPQAFRIRSARVVNLDFPFLRLDQCRSSYPFDTEECRLEVADQEFSGVNVWEGNGGEFGLFGSKSGLKEMRKMKRCQHGIATLWAVVFSFKEV